MWAKTKLFTASCFALLCCWCVLPVTGSCSEFAEGETMKVMTVSKTDWLKLKTNNDAQKKALEESQIALTEASEALSASRAALEESEKELETSKAELEALRREYELQKAELITLRAELKTQKNESATASDALTKANQFLADTKAEIEAREAAWRKREAQLEMQRLLWQIACLVVGGVAAAV